MMYNEDDEDLKDYFHQCALDESQSVDGDDTNDSEELSPRALTMSRERSPPAAQPYRQENLPTRSLPAPGTTLPSERHTFDASDSKSVTEECLYALTGLETLLLLRIGAEGDRGRWQCAQATGKNTTFVLRIVSWCNRLDTLRSFEVSHRKATQVPHPVVTCFVECLRAVDKSFITEMLNIVRDQSLTEPFHLCQYISGKWAPVIVCLTEVVSLLDMPLRHPSSALLDRLLDSATLHQVMNHVATYRVLFSVFLYSLSPLLHDIESFVQTGELPRSNTSVPLNTAFEVEALPGFLKTHGDAIVGAMECMRHIPRTKAFKSLLQKWSDGTEGEPLPLVGFQRTKAGLGFVLAEGRDHAIKISGAMRTSELLNWFITEPLLQLCSEAQQRQARYVHVECGFIKFFNALEKYMLCSQGDLYSYLCHILFTTDVQWWLPNSLYFVTEAFNTALMMTHHVDATSVPVHLIYQPHENETGTWHGRIDGLRLVVTVPDSLVPLITPGILAKYNDAFRFLIRLIFTKTFMTSSWKAHKDQLVSSRQALSLRMQLNFIVTTVQGFVFGKLRSLGDEFRERAASAESVGMLRSVHDKFLIAVAHVVLATQDKRPVQHHFTTLLRLATDQVNRKAVSTQDGDALFMLKRLHHAMGTLMSTMSRTSETEELTLLCGFNSFYK